jgi:hypothetical protein
VSNIASVAVTILPVNDPPIAANDVFRATANIPVVLNLVANDRDPDSATEPLIVAGLSAISPAEATIVSSGGSVTFTAALPGTYAFTYFAQDSQGALSPLPATVTVNVATQELLAITKAEFRQKGGRLRVDGIVIPASFQTIAVQLLNNDDVALAYAGTATPDVTGTWFIDLRNYQLPQGTTRVRAATASGTSQTLSLTIRP